jgi:hypothetical protein
MYAGENPPHPPKEEVVRVQSGIPAGMIEEISSNEENPGNDTNPKRGRQTKEGGIRERDPFTNPAIMSPLWSS